MLPRVSPQCKTKPLTAEQQIFSNDYRAEHMVRLLMAELHNIRFFARCAGCGRDINFTNTLPRVKAYWHNSQPHHAYAICESCTACRTHSDFEDLERRIHASQGPKVK